MGAIPGRAMCTSMIVSERSPIGLSPPLRGPLIRAEEQEVERSVGPVLGALLLLSVAAARSPPPAAPSRSERVTRSS